MHTKSKFKISNYPMRYFERNGVLYACYLHINISLNTEKNRNHTVKDYKFTELQEVSYMVAWNQLNHFKFEFIVPA